MEFIDHRIFMCMNRLWDYTQLVRANTTSPPPPTTTAIMAMRTTIVVCVCDRFGLQCTCMIIYHRWKLCLSWSQTWRYRIKVYKLMHRRGSLNRSCAVCCVAFIFSNIVAYLEFNREWTKLNFNKLHCAGAAPSPPPPAMLYSVCSAV